jgi:hypothetical protein
LIKAVPKPYNNKKTLVDEDRPLGEVPLNRKLDFSRP